MKSKKNVFLIGASTLCLSTTFASSIPEWVESGKHVKYPSSIFLVGVGTALEQADAESNALSSIGKQIRSSVQTAAKSEVSSFGENVNSYFNQSVAVDSSEQIQGAKFVERFKSSENLWSVLAVVKISDLLAQRKQEAMDCFDKASRLNVLNGKSGVTTSATETFQSAVTLQIRKMECGRKYSDFRSIESLSPAVTKLNQDAAAADLAKREEQLSSSSIALQNQLRKLSFSTTCEKKIEVGKEKAASSLESQASICEDLEKILLDFGLSKGGLKPTFELKIRYSAREKKARSASLVFLQSKVAIEILDTTNNTVFFKGTVDDEAGGSSFESAMMKVDKKLVEKSTASFVQVFNKKD